MFPLEQVIFIDSDILSSNLSLIPFVIDIEISIIINHFLKVTKNSPTLSPLLLAQCQTYLNLHQCS